MKAVAMAMVVVVVLALAPPSLVTKCADPEFRQDNLALCNMHDEPPIGGGPRRHGLLGLGIGPL